MSRYDTNLAGEFYALACLHRLGVTANLTLGNKKGVDIVVARKAGDAVTVEVKALAGKDYWPAQNLGVALCATNRNRSGESAPPGRANAATALRSSGSRAFGPVGPRD